MPSGLTCKIYEGTDLSLRDFALRCATQFGGFYQVTEQGSKDLPMTEPPVLVVEKYRYEWYEKAKEKALYWLNVEKDPELAQKLYQEYVDSRVEQKVDFQERDRDLRDRYQAMYDKIDAWDVAEPYKNIKELMLKQIKESMDHDCPEDGLKYYDYPIPSFDDWLQGQISFACKDVEYQEEALQKAIKSVAETNAYIKGFYEELDKVEPLK